MQVPAAARLQPVQRSRTFYPAMAALAAVVVFVGFARTYYLKEFFGSPPLPLLLHVHGFVMSCWIGLLLVQTTLIAAHRTHLHRRVGIAGGVLAIAVAATGVAAAIRSVRLGRAPAGGSPSAFLAIPLGDIFVFSVLVAAALYFRRRPELHKRLMLIGTIAILPAAIARWPWPLIAHQPPRFFLVTDLLLIGCIAYDCARTRRLSPAYLWAGLLLIASHPLRLMFAGSAAWTAFAHWITGV
jgi:uncharacterized membrane protein